ncbi:histidine kinase [Streptomyces sp. NPDC091212]|uniref:sensor histidine kinase n=1 Tax=Streptomyces sp. NPDC091212 TaxID=3155191 RepID=UPI0034351FF4
MSGLTDWWHRKSKPVKVELYTRWSFHSFVAMEIALSGIPMLRSAVLNGEWPTGLCLFLLVCAHAALCGVMSSRALDWRLGRGEQPVRLVVAVAALTLAGLFAFLALRSTGTVLFDGGAIYLVTGLAGFGTATASLVLPRAAHTRYALLGVTAVVSAAGLLLGLATPEIIANAVGILITGAFFIFAYGFSVWLLKAVWDLDTARELQTRLAVAEERLRFGRDMHDVMGRNLAVIALKSELAVQLAERGRPEAIAQMTEVQRIARESQREVRDVVRGYREADLHTELDGARGVLAAAGIDCRIEEETAAPLPAEVQSALGWVVREATTNVLRHGDARRCTVRLSAPEGGGGAVLTVENDGVPDPADGAPSRHGSGLAGLRERLAALDGTLEAGVAEDGCFRLTARVPLPRAAPTTGRTASTPRSVSATATASAKASAKAHRSVSALNDEMTP